MQPIATRRTLLVLIAINALTYLFVGWAVPSARDYRAFYFGGETARRAPSQLYDLDYQLKTQQDEFADRAKFLPFFHPPHELLLFAPLSKLPYTASLNAWRILSVLFLVLSGVLIAKSIGAEIIDVTMLVAAVYAVPMCVLLGQDSLLLLLLICGCFYLLRRNLDLAAGLVLALALFKPQVPVILALALLASGRAKFFAWFAAFGSALAAASIPIVGWSAVHKITAMAKIAEGGLGVSAMPSIRGLIALVAGDHRWVSIAVLIIALAGFVPAWRKSRSLEFTVASSICVASAFPLYVYAYDLVVLAVPLALLARHFQRKDLPILAALTSAPLSQIVYFGHAAALLALPTLALAYTTFRLRGSAASSEETLQLKPMS
jgi:hypothetical protein